MSAQLRPVFLSIYALLVCLLTSVLNPVSLNAEEPQKPRTDAFGDPLPKDALVRLGSSRFRAVGATNSLVFGPEDKTLLAHCGLKVVVWDRRTGKELRRFRVQGETSCFSPDGRYLAVLKDGVIHLWSTEKAKVLKLIKAGETGYQAPICFSFDGKWLAVAHGLKVYLCEWQSGKEIGSFPVQFESRDRELKSLAISPDGKFLAMGIDRAPVQTWSIAGKKKIASVKEKPDDLFLNARHLRFSPNSTKLIIRDFAEIKVTEVTTGRKLRTITAHVAMQPSLGFFRNGRTIISAAQGRGVTTWDLTTGKKTATLKSYPLRYPVLTVSHDGKTLASGCSDGNSPLYVLWDLATGKELFPNPRHEGGIELGAFSQDGKQFYTADQKEMHTWDVKTGKPLNRTRHHVYRSDSISPDHRFIVGGGFNSINLKDFRTGKELKDREMKYVGKSNILRVTFSPDSTQIITAHNRNTPKSFNRKKTEGKNGLAVWGLAAGKLLREWTTDKDVFFTSLAVTPDGHLATMGTAKGRSTRSENVSSTYYDLSKGGSIYVWDLKTGEEVFTLNGHTAASRSVVISPDGRWLVSSGHDQTVRLWELLQADPSRPSAQTAITEPELPSHQKADSWQPRGLTRMAPARSYYSTSPTLSLFTL